VLITRVELTDFRNYERFTLEPAAGLTVLVGPNAAGKTNVIEAIQLVTAARSFRRPEFSDLIRWGTDSARVALRAEEAERVLEIELRVDEPQGRSYLVGGQSRKRHADVSGLLPSVTFTPDDLALVKGPAERRRAAVDDLGEQLSPTYGSLRKDYGKVVRQRNAMLRDGAGGDALLAWDEQLVSLGTRLVVHRLGLLERTMVHATERYSDMTGGERLGYSYADRCGLGTCSGVVVAEIEESLRAELVRRAREERLRAVTLVGPHRDDIVLDIDGRDARTFGSQGQQRTAALAWKLAEVEMVQEVLRRKPVLLLDDVMSELDADRRAALSQVVASRIQTIVTTTTTAYFTTDTLADASIVDIARRGV
jgi:DNA replication and repair protein RecF